MTSIHLIGTVPISQCVDSSAWSRYEFRQPRGLLKTSHLSHEQWFEQRTQLTEDEPASRHTQSPLQLTQWQNYLF